MSRSKVDKKLSPSGFSLLFSTSDRFMAGYFTGMFTADAMMSFSEYRFRETCTAMGLWPALVVWEPIRWQAARIVSLRSGILGLFWRWHNKGLRLDSQQPGHIGCVQGALGILFVFEESKNFFLRLGSKFLCNLVQLILGILRQTKAVIEEIGSGHLGGGDFLALRPAQGRIP